MKYEIAGYFPIEAREYAAGLEYDFVEVAPSFKARRTKDGFCPLGAACAFAKLLIGRHAPAPHEIHNAILSGFPPTKGKRRLLIGPAYEFTSGWDGGDILDLRDALGLEAR